MWQIYSPLPIVTTIAIQGLANRLRGIASGLILAHAMGYGFNVFWDAEPQAPAHFLDLFEDPGFPFVPQSPRGWYLFSSQAERSAPWFKLKIPGTGCSAPGAEGEIALGLDRPEPIMLETFHNLKPAEMSDEEFMRRKRQFLTGLRPLPPIQTAIDTVTSNFGPNAVGVHARTTDTAYFWGGEYPAQQLYFEQMDQYLDEDPRTMFFIASDSNEMLDAATARYGQRALSSLEVLNRARADRMTMEGQVEAVIDLFCLARTNALIGTHVSSFSYEAAAMGNVPLIEIAGKKKRPWHVPGSIVISEQGEVEADS